VPAVEIEMHYRGKPAIVWYFLYGMEGNTATVLEYYTNSAEENLFTDGGPATASDGGSR
jgi:hypothetical protein